MTKLRAASDSSMAARVTSAHMNSTPRYFAYYYGYFT